MINGISELELAKKHRDISLNIKNISEEQIIKEYGQLREIWQQGKIETTGERCLIGNGIVDYFTFTQRLYTRGKYNVNFYEFVERIEEFKEKKFIQNMFHYYATVKNKNGQKNKYVVLKEIYNICISSINIIRPLNYMEIYAKYKPSSVLDFCCGWGGAAVAARERPCGLGGYRDWGVGADIGTRA